MSTNAKLINTGRIAVNKKASFNYFLEEKFEAGIVLTGSEVKSLRQGKASISEAYVSVEEDGNLYLINATIQENPNAVFFGHKPTRPRALLLHKKEVKRLTGAVARKGDTLSPVALYFNDKGIAKLEIALATGKKLYDKRQTEKDRDWARQKASLLKSKN